MRIYIYIGTFSGLDGVYTKRATVNATLALIAIINVRNINIV